MRTIAKIFGSLVAAMILPLIGHAQRSEEAASSPIFPEPSSNSEFIVKVWRTADGLPVNVIYDIQQTPNGYLWLATSQGLVRFDGVNLQSYLTVPTGNRFGPRIEDLEIDERGRLWIVPQQVGVIRLENGHFTEFLTNKTGRASSFCSDGAGWLWVVENNGSLSKISTDEPDQFQKIKSNLRGAVRWVRDFQNQMWLVTTDGMARLRNERLERMFRVPLPGFVAAPRRDGGFWLAGAGKLEFLAENGAREGVTKLPWSDAEARVNLLFQDSQHRLWIGTSTKGLFCYSNGIFKRVAATRSSVMCIFEDRERNIWVGTRGAGLMRIRTRQFFVQDVTGGLQNDYVHSLMQDNSGRIWIASDEGHLGFWKTNSWHPFDEQGWSRSYLHCVFPANDGGMWLACRNGVWHWRDGKFTKLKLPKRFSQPVVGIREDQQGRLWMITEDAGIFFRENNRFKHASELGLNTLRIRSIAEDNDGTIWTGDWRGGIARLRGSRWEIVRAQGEHGDAARTMVVADGVVWIGTASGGLLRVKDGKFTRLTTEQGLPNSYIQQLLLDERGSLWGATPRALFRVSLKDLNAVMDGAAERIEPIVFGTGDGLPETDFLAWFQPRSWKTREGELWFATANGAVHFQPAEIKFTNEPPNALIESVLLNGKTADLKTTELRPGAGRLEFRFTAPAMTAPERVRFHYQLTGVDANWVDAEKLRSVTYASLPSGKHVFRVVASSPDGVWNSTPAAIAFSVNPYFWQTNWFIIAIAGISAGAMVWIARRATVARLNRRLTRLRHEHALTRERARIAQDIHDELGANLTSIGLLADLGTRHKTSPSSVAADFKQISATARETVSVMDAIVWALNPRNDSLDHFANYLAQYTREFFRPSQLRTRLDIPADLPMHAMSPEVRHQLFLVVKESFNNIVRHADASEVQVALKCDKGELRLRIADDGKGFADAATMPGQDGLINVRERIERIGGCFHIESEPGKGTTLDSILPLEKFKGN